MADIITFADPCRLSGKSSQASYPFQLLNVDPSHLDRILPRKWQKTFDENPGTDIVVSMGPKGSMIRNYCDEEGSLKTCKPCQWSILRVSVQLISVTLDLDSERSILSTIFSPLEEQPDLSDFFISLGHHGWYCFTSNDYSRIQGPPDLMALSGKEKVWFGYKDSWVAQTESSLYWDLKGYYGNLEEVLRDNRRFPQATVVSKIS